MGVRYYLSGCAHENAFFGTLGDALKRDLKKREIIVYISGNPSDYGDAHCSSDWFNQQFEKAGIGFKKSYVIDYKVPYFLAKRWILKADMVFLLGGNPIEQKRMCKKLGILKLLKEYEKVMMGMSAGAMLMSKYILIMPISDEYPDFVILNGLDRDNLSIYPHNNTKETEYPDTLCLDDSIYQKEDIIKTAAMTEPFYLLQDVHEEDICHMSFIRATDNGYNLITENNGQAWKATKKGIYPIQYT